MTKILWHPMTQHGIFPDSIPVDHAQGTYLHTKDGRRIIDGIASWWLNTHGHCHPHIVKAVQEQAARLEQVIFAGFTHDPAEELAERLMAKTHATLGNKLQHIFLSDSGSTAIEVALKMALGYFEHTGRPRHKIIALENGYHGDTFGTMSTGARGVFNKLYEPLLFDVDFIPFPSDDGSNTLAAFEELLQQNKDEIAALILEPIVQGAAGMRIYSDETLKALRELCDRHGVLLIADEVMTGFGRIGTFFACEQAGISPDLLCLSKGITGGFLPMGATLATGKIYQAFYDTQDRSKTFFHSTSFTGNPLACAAANASLDIWEREPVLERIADIEAQHKNAAAKFAQYPCVSETRVKGSILALDVIDPNPGYLSTLGPDLYRYFLSKNILLRPIGNTIYVLPPYCITAEDLQTIYDAIDEKLHEITGISGA